MSSVHKRGPRVTLRARVLAIALVPSLVLLSAGVGLSAYLLLSAIQQRDRAELLGRGYEMAVPFMPAMSQERSASILAVSSPTPENRTSMAQARQNMDRLLGQFRTISTQVAGAMPPTAKAAIGKFVAQLPDLIATRQAIDAGQVSRLDVYRAYSDVADAMIVAAGAIGKDSTDKDVALDRIMAADLMRASDWLDRANALATGALAGDGMSIEELHEYNRLTQGYHAQLDALAPRLTEQQDQLAALRSSAAWNQLSAVENTFVEQQFARHGQVPPNAATRTAAETSGTESSRTERSTTGPSESEPPGGGPSVLPLSPQDWQSAAHDSATRLSTLGLGTLGIGAAAVEHERADAALVRSLAAALGMLLVIGTVLIVAIRLSNGLIRRLVRLRTETLKLADEQLPHVVERLRAGERIDLSVELPELDHGKDEIGQVAAAFNKAHHTAVATAVQEAKTREGINTVFLNIARRSQAIVHRQLQVLDAAERAVDDPDHLELLFQLDHSTTRERRNAENLIILGGGQLGRQWRNSVSLIEIVRSAVAEAEQYTRVTIGRVPDILVDGRVVADLIHLLAELIDNATSFSPPGSRIEIRGNRVGKGMVVEVEDQGLGIEADRRKVVNEMFRNPPNFGLMALSDDARIGFFVVAHLAHRHGIKVSLDESTYGGVRAGVLIPTILVNIPGAHEESTEGAAGNLAADQTSPSIAAEAPPHQNGTTQPQRTATDTRSLFTENSDALPRRVRHTDDRPPLPRRRRQQNLAWQLQEEQLQEDTENQVSELDFDRAAKHAQNTLSAFQQGTARGRVGGDTSEP